MLNWRGMDNVDVDKIDMDMGIITKEDISIATNLDAAATMNAMHTTAALQHAAISWPVYLFWWTTLLVGLFFSFIAYIVAINWKFGGGGRNMMGDRSKYKGGRAGFLALCYFIRNTIVPFNYQWCVIVPAILVLLHRRCCMDFTRPFLRRWKISKFIRIGLFLLILMSFEWYAQK